MIATSHRPEAGDKIKLDKENYSEVFVIWFLK